MACGDGCKCCVYICGSITVLIGLIIGVQYEGNFYRTNVNAKRNGSGELSRFFVLL